MKEIEEIEEVEEIEQIMEDFPEIYKGLSEKDIVEVGRLFNYRQMINNELFG